ncbi:hypothetical protein HanXRQr2_Chr17g0798341 [Helianthus annuus]|uniref:Uncharacterized protein n=1 Tax=Helianthus annuus TaxID=4232 RepID=A0A251RPH8_HELAN|nr:hypothetical protein HanXRQr2_Chr17g0798341 [Helianthus annuus]
MAKILFMICFLLFLVSTSGSSGVSNFPSKQKDSLNPASVTVCTDVSQCAKYCRCPVSMQRCMWYMCYCDGIACPSNV